MKRFARSSATSSRSYRESYVMPLNESPAAAIASKEYMFPFVTVVECPESKMLGAIGPTLVQRRHLQPEVPRHRDRRRAHRPPQPRPVPTTQLNWLQPHEGNLIEFLFRGRAFQTANL